MIMSARMTAVYLPDWQAVVTACGLTAVSRQADAFYPDGGFMEDGPVRPVSLDFIHSIAFASSLNI